MSAIPPKADMVEGKAYVRFVPLPDVEQPRHSFDGNGDLLRNHGWVENVMLGIAQH